MEKFCHRGGRRGIETFLRPDRIHVKVWNESGLSSHASLLFYLDGLRRSRPSHSSSCHSTFSLQTSNRFRRESASSGYGPSLQQNTLWKHSGSIMCDILGLQCWKFMYIDFRLVSAFSRLRSPFSHVPPPLLFFCPTHSFNTYHHFLKNIAISKRIVSRCARLWVNFRVFTGLH